MGALIILESASGVRGVSPSRSGVLASELAEVRVGLAGGVVPLGKKPEMEQTIPLMGQGRSVLRDNVSMVQGAPDLLPTASGKPPVREPGLCFVRLLGLLCLLCNQGRQSTQ